MPARAVLQARWPSLAAARRSLGPPGLPMLVVLFALGICATMRLPALPSPSFAWAVLAAALLAAWRLPRGRWLALPLLGFGWAALHGHWALAERLPPALAGADLEVTGRIDGLPTPGLRHVAFDLIVDSGAGDAALLAGRRLRLAWYEPGDVVLQPGQRWRLTVRLRRPRGVQNPGGFDYERHALLQHIAATGHVRGEPELLADGGGIDRLRLSLSQRIAETVGDPRARFLQGLAIGDTRALEPSDWSLLRATGLSHLLAISGLHIGLIAALAAWSMRALYRLVPGLGLRLPRPQAQALAALLAASGYALLAGFSLPAQRSLLMIATVSLALLTLRRASAWHVLALAAGVLLLLDPLVVLGPGFWLSFAGVLWLLLSLSGRRERGLHSLVRAQLAMAIGLLPLSLWFFGQVSLAGAGLNLIAVPLVGMLVVPLTLLGTLLLPVPWLATPLLRFAAASMDLLLQGAERIAAWPWAQLSAPDVSLPLLLLGLLGAGWCLLPRSLPGRPFAALLLLPLLWPATPTLARGELALDLIDVGQGLSLLLRTSSHALLYDAGPAFAGGLDLGEAAVLPALRALAVDDLDRFIVSHGDNDHAGGADAVRARFPDTPVASGEPRRVAAAACVAGERWQWDGVDFELLHPTAGFPELRNESSCVLRVTAPGGSVLLAGDIDEVIEARLLRQVPDRLPARVLLVPHHGSAGSSTAAFLAAVRPELALIAVGADNRFGHPRAEALARYQAIGTQIERTDRSGELALRLHADGALELARRRQTDRRFWHEP